VLHFVGDMHQPLHSSDNHDRGGNSVKVFADGIPHQAKDELHGNWDMQFVDAIGGKSPPALAKQLLAQIAPDQAVLWAAGSFDEWAVEAYMISKNDVYGSPPLSKATPQHLDAAYVARAEKDVAQQLSRPASAWRPCSTRRLDRISLPAPTHWETFPAPHDCDIVCRTTFATYGGSSPKHLGRYVDEFAFRLNEGNVKNHTLTLLAAVIYT
jgi:hypothetical protein